MVETTAKSTLRDYMKRSEMLTILRLFAKGYNGFKGCSIDFIAREILIFSEEVGMLPPPTTIFNTDDDNNPIWEPEDE